MQELSDIIEIKINDLKPEECIFEAITLAEESEENLEDFVMRPEVLRVVAITSRRPCTVKDLSVLPGPITGQLLQDC